ncbi:hypothetical protein F2Q69_00003422 [Brassica cretica]|uniref:Uncharacterized protein n=1 Tax=Brassica cretica TaxID=69181 RepID=A0A8S9PEA7_BRACR|nr:hypothetical protein F2Q69_00003422 [Brassica cretica]
MERVKAQAELKVAAEILKRDEHKAEKQVERKAVQRLKEVKLEGTTAVKQSPYDKLPFPQRVIAKAQKKVISKFRKEMRAVGVKLREISHMLRGIVAERSIWCGRTTGHGRGLRPYAGLDEDGARTSTADEHGPRKQGREVEFSCGRTANHDRGLEPSAVDTKTISPICLLGQTRVCWVDRFEF